MYIIVRWFIFVLLLILILMPMPSWDEEFSPNVYKLTLTEKTPLYKDRIKWVEPISSLQPQAVVAEQSVPGWHLIQTRMGYGWIQADSSMTMKRENVALGKPYTIHTPYRLDKHFEEIASPYSQNRLAGLTDGQYGESDYHSAAYIGMFSLGSRTITVDLQESTGISEISLSFLHDSSAGIYVPRNVQVWTSMDNKVWTDWGRMKQPLSPTFRKTLSHRYMMENIDAEARYVRLMVEMTGNSLFLDEVEIWGSVKGEAQQVIRESAKQDPSSPIRSRNIPGVNSGKNFPSARWFKNQVLIYTGFLKEDPLRSLTFTKEDFKPYVSYLDQQEKRKDWMFDSYLFLPYAHLWDESGFHSTAGKPAVKHHWDYFLDRLFREGHELQALEEAMLEAKLEMKDESRRVNVVIGIPFPPTDQSSFGDIDSDGIMENLNVQDIGEAQVLKNRKKLVKWFIDEVMSRWQEEEFKHIRLIGFYWYNEALAEEKSNLDEDLIRWTADLLHQRGLMFEWIPYFFSNGWNDWEELGFDVAIFQPNYMFHRQASESRIDTTADAALDYGLGLEIEMKDDVLYDSHWRDRYFAYLNKYKKFGYMGRSYQVVYQEFKTLFKASKSSDPAVREIYDKTYLYLKGNY